MARIPPTLRRDLDELDAEARTVLDRQKQKLPAWVGLYLHLNTFGGERISIVWRSRDRVPRGGAVPTIQAHKPQFAAIIDDAGRLDPTARYLMRMWMAEHRRRLAARRDDRDAQLAAKATWRWLLTHPPSRDRGARNIGGANVERDATRAAEWRRWQDEADRIWARRCGLSKTAVAGLVKTQLKLGDHVKTIARRIHPPK